MFTTLTDLAPATFAVLATAAFAYLAIGVAAIFIAGIASETRRVRAALARREDPRAGALADALTPFGAAGIALLAVISLTVDPTRPLLPVIQLLMAAAMTAETIVRTRRRRATRTAPAPA